MLKPVEILLYAELWFGDAEKFVTQIRAAGSAPILFRINSPGGSCFDGNAIYNALLAHKAEVTVQVDGLAASVASLIAMAGKKILMAENAMMMIHNPSSGAHGEAADLRRNADILDAIKVSCVTAYMRRIGERITPEQLAAMMDAETWFTAEDAKKLGLCDEIIAAVPATNLALFDSSKFRNPPPQLKTMFKLTASIATLLATATGLAITEAASEADVTAAISKLAADSAAMKSKLTAAEAGLATMTAERDDLKDQFTALAASATEAKAKLATAEGSLAAMTADRDGLKTKLAIADDTNLRLKQLCDVKGVDPKAAPPVIEEPGSKTMSRAEFTKLAAGEQSQFCLSGGKIVE